MDCTVLEALERHLTFFLRFVTVNGVSIDADALKRACKTTTGNLGIDENEHLRERRPFRTARLKHIDEHICLFAVIDGKKLLRHRLSSGIFAGNFDYCRVVLEEALGELF